MNKTPNYQLNQWEADDRVQRVDFNADNAKIDAALGTLARQIATVSENGLRLDAGSYVGDGTTSRSIDFSSTLGRPPKVLVLKSSTQLAIWIKPESGDKCGLATWSGSKVTWTAQVSYDTFNSSGSTYYYFALG